MLNSLKHYLKKAYAPFYNPYSRYGKVFREWYAFLLESQWWDQERLELFQIQKLKEILNHAFSNIPHYRKIFQEWGLNPSDVKDLRDLKRFPFIHKDDVVNALEQLISVSISKNRRQYVTTAGSTGQPLGLYWDREKTDPMEEAFVLRWRNWAGFEIGDPLIILESRIGNSKKMEKLFYENPLRNILILAYPMMSNENIKEVFKKIETFAPKFVAGHPSAVNILAQYCREYRKSLSIKFKGIFTSSETLLLSQREFIEQVFQCRVFDLYGHTERAGAAAQCGTGENYHMFSEYGLIELIDENDQPITKTDKIGQIVTTGFLNHLMPLIRYKTGDYAQYSNGPCPCGRGLPLIKGFFGRIQEFLVTKKNTLVSLTSLNMHNELFYHVFQYQFYQDRPGWAEIRVVPKSGFTEEDSNRIIQTLRSVSSNLVDFCVKVVRNVETTSAGKHRILIQRIPNVEYKELALEKPTCP